MTELELAADGLSCPLSLSLSPGQLGIAVPAVLEYSRRSERERGSVSMVARD